MFCNKGFKNKKGDYYVLLFRYAKDLVELAFRKDYNFETKRYRKRF